MLPDAQSKSHLKRLSTNSKEIGTVSLIVKKNGFIGLIVNCILKVLVFGKKIR